MEPDYPVVMPLRPRFIHEAVVVPFGSDLLIDGMSQFQVFRGGAARSILPNLISLMDGTRGLTELESAIPRVPSEKVRAAISLLFANGLIEDAAADPADGPVPNSETLAFFRRFLQVTGVNRSGGEACARLAHEVVIVESKESACGEAIRSLLIDSSLKATRLIGLGGLDSMASGALIISASSGGEDCTWHADLDAWCAQHQAPWLRTVWDADQGYADLGPLFTEPDRGCFQCFWDVQGRASSPTVTESESANVAFWSGMVAAEIIYLLSRAGPAAARIGFRRYDLRSWESTDLQYPRVPGCSRCRPLAANSRRQSGLDTALVFEDYVARQPMSANDPKADVESARLGATLGRQTKRLAFCEQRALSRSVPELGRPALDAVYHCGAGSDRLSVDDLAVLLLMTGGIRAVQPSDEQLRRWMSTAGNLGSVELFVIVRDVEGLAPGTYFYQPREHALAAIRWRTGGLEAESFMRRAIACASDELPDALVVFTGAMHRVSRKYGAFGYKLINLDAGAAASHLHAVADGLQLFSFTATSWFDDLIEEQLGLDAFNEQVTAVVGVSRGRPVATEDRGKGIERAHQAKAIRDFYEVPAFAIAELLYRESRTKEVEGPIEPHAAHSGSSAERSDRSHTIVALPPVVQEGSSVGQTLAKRRTVRHYSERAIPLQLLHTMLRQADREDRADWPRDHRDGHLLTFRVLAWRVAGVEPAVYVYSPQEAALRHSMPAPPLDQAVNLLVQPEFGLAPLQIWITGDLAAASARYGVWGHRQLLLRAGAAAYRLWFSGIAMGLSGAIVAGVVAGTARPLFGLDGYRNAALVAVMAGFEDNGLPLTSVPAP